MFHKIAAIYRDLKHQDILQASLAIQNLKSPASFSSPQIYQPTEPSLTVKLQELPLELQYIQPCLSKVWNCNKIESYSNGNWNNMVCTYKLFMSNRLWRTQNGEIEPFWYTLIIFTCADVQCFITPMVVHQSTQYTQDIHYNIPIYWLVHNPP